MESNRFQEGVRAHRRAVALLGAAALLPFVVIDAWAGAPAVLHLTRAGWLLALLAAAAMLRPGARTDPGLPIAVVSVTSVAAILVAVWATGGVRSGYFGFLLALPLCLALLVPGASWLAALCGAAATAWGTAMLVASGQPPLQTVRWFVLSVVTALVATVGTRLSRALVRQRLEAEQARADLAERVAEQARRLAETQQLAVAGRLAAGVAHEVSNPLAYLKANLGVLRERLAATGLDGDLAGALADAEQGVDRIARIVGDLRDVTRSGADRPCSAPVAEAIAEARKIAAHRAGGAELRIAIEPGVPPARICRGRLVQIVVNLLVNSADALDAARGAGRGWIAVSAAPSGGGVALVVEDGGPGFARDVLPRALEPFVTTKDPGRGMGLGLALAREYVTRARGRIAAANAPHGGARVELWLPAAEEEDQGDCTPCEYRPAPGATPRPLWSGG